MGDPKRIRPKAETPRKVWDSDRIKEESALKREYGLRKTRELWAASSELKKMRRTARNLLSHGEDGVEQGKSIIAKLRRLGIAKTDMELDDILALSVRDFLERRLQTLVLKKGLARTPKQSRQLIVHGFISVAQRRVNIPSYMVTSAEEPSISYFKAIDISIPEDEPEKKSAPVKKQAEPAKENRPAKEAIQKKGDEPAKA